MKIDFQSATLQLPGQTIKVDGVLYQITNGPVTNYGNHNKDVALMGVLDLEPVEDESESYDSEEDESESYDSEEDEDTDVDCECDLCLPPNMPDVLELQEAPLGPQAFYTTPVGEVVKFNGVEYRLETACVGGHFTYRRV